MTAIRFDEALSPFDEGLESFEFGMTQDACPYPVGSAECAEWLEGWSEGQARSQDL
jgi:ribosome modulation factor